MADVDSKLAASLKQAKTNAMFFVFIAKGNESKLLVDKKNISAKDVSEAKKECGGGTTYKGRCKGEEGKLVFEVGKEVSPALSALTKKIIKQAAGLTFDVEYRIAADLTAEENSAESAGEDGTPPAAAAPKPQPAQGGAEMTQRLNGLSANIKAGLAGPNKARVQTLFGSVNGHIKNKDFVAAATVLDELELLVANAGAAPASAAKEPLATRFAGRLKALAPVMQRAEQTGSPQAAAAKLQIAEGNKLYLAKQYQPANEALDRAEALVKQAFASATPAAHAAPPKPAPEPDAGLQAEWERKIVALEPRVLQARKDRPDDAKWLTLFMSAQDLGGAGDFAKALGVLDRIEGLLNAPANKPANDNGSFVTFTQARLQWDSARKTVLADLQKLEQSILKIFAKLPKLPKTKLAELAAGAKKLYAILDRLDERLIDKLDEALNAKTPEDRAAMNAQAAGIVKEYQAFVNADPLINKIDGNPFVPVNVRGHMLQTLNELAAKLA